MKIQNTTEATTLLNRTEISGEKSVALYPDNSAA